MLLLNKNAIGLEIKDGWVNLIYGNKNNIKYYENIKIESNDCSDGRVLNINEVANKIKECLKENKIKCNNVSFIVNGSDVITRYIELPTMKEESLRETVYFEFGQFIKELDLYYMDYEILEKINLDNKKSFKILLVACPKNKIDSLVDLSNKLQLKIKDIDIMSNSIYRVIKNSNLFNEKIKNLGVFYLGYKNSTFFIMEKNIIYIDKFIYFGFYDVLNEIKKVKKNDLLNKEKYKSLKELFEDIPKVKYDIDNVLQLINNIIQFYADGKSKKMLDKIIILSEFEIHNDIEKYINDMYGVKCEVIKNGQDLGIKTKNIDNLPKPISTYGLFLRGK